MTDITLPPQQHVVVRLRDQSRAFSIFALLLGVTILAVAHPFWEQTPAVLKEVFITLTVVAGIHLLDRMYLFRDTEKTLLKLSQTIAEQSERQHAATQAKLKEATESTLADATKSTVTSLNAVVDDLEKMIAGVDSKTEEALDETKKYLSHVSGSMQAMNIVGIQRIYKSRDEASDDMLRDLDTDGPVDVRLMGISLTDFVQGKGNYGAAWNRFKDRVSGAGTASKSKLSLRLLLIHPFCLGAQLRSKGEARGTDAIKSRLMTDVQSVTEEIENLQKTAADNVSIECRLYQLPPTLFLYSVNKACYMQPYFFWNRRQDLPVPIFKFVTGDGHKADRQIAHQLTEHFDLIWAKASISLEDFRHENILGVDKGMRQSGAVNVFLEKSESRKRILKMLKGARSTVWIQGISLQSFFSPGDIYKEIIRIILTGNIDVRILVMDPASEQARLRSFRERLFVAKDATLQSYLDSGHHEESALYTDTMRTIKGLNSFMEHLIDDRGGVADWGHRLQVRQYKSAPSCFVLRVDDHVLVEQYHYGKAKQSDQPEMDVAILGKEMPLLEFADKPDDLYDSSDEVDQRVPFRLLEDHFQFAFDNAQDVLSERVRSRCLGALPANA